MSCAAAEAWDQTCADFERIVGFEYLRGMHLNDDYHAPFNGTFVYNYPYSQAIQPGIELGCAAENRPVERTRRIR
jgi:hypothetical protein